MKRLTLSRKPILSWISRGRIILIHAAWLVSGWTGFTILKPTWTDYVVGPSDIGTRVMTDWYVRESYRKTEDRYPIYEKDQENETESLLCEAFREEDADRIISALRDVARIERDLGASKTGLREAMELADRRYADIKVHLETIAILRDEIKRLKGVEPISYEADDRALQEAEETILRHKREALERKRDFAKSATQADGIFTSLLTTTTRTK
jgi:FtsZ-binding cell division protein ZapB